MEAKQIGEILKNKLRAVSVEVEDESAAHAGHEGAQLGGGHYRITVVSDLFAGKTALERHRLVYSALEKEMGRDIHALAIKALSPAETESE